MTAWLYLGIFVFLNVVVWLGLERIHRHLAEINRQLASAVSLLGELARDSRAMRSRTTGGADSRDPAPAADTGAGGGARP